MKNPSSTNRWQPCPTGLIHHLTRRIEVERRRKWIGNLSTVLILSAGFLFAGMEYWQASVGHPTPPNVAPTTDASHRPATELGLSRQESDPEAGQAFRAARPR